MIGYLNHLFFGRERFLIFLDKVFFVSSAQKILLNSVDRDGQKNGFDLNIITKVLKKINIPVILCGGAGRPEDFYDAFTKTNVESLAASNLFHHIEHGDYMIKKYLFEKSINVRKPKFFSKNMLK